MLMEIEFDHDKMQEFGDLIGAHVVQKITPKRRLAAWLKGERLVDYKRIINAAFTFYKWRQKEMKTGRKVVSAVETTTSDLIEVKTPEILFPTQVK